MVNIMLIAKFLKVMKEMKRNIVMVYLRVGANTANDNMRFVRYEALKKVILGNLSETLVVENYNPVLNKRKKFIKQIVGRKKFSYGQQSKQIFLESEKVEHTSQYTRTFKTCKE